jgi:hypothetical protein
MKVLEVGTFLSQALEEERVVSNWPLVNSQDCNKFAQQHLVVAP